MSIQTRNSRFSKKSPRSRARHTEKGKAAKSAVNPAKNADSRPARKPKRLPKGRLSRGGASQDWIWGQHAVIAALSNRARTIHEIWMTEPAARRISLPPHLNAVVVRQVEPGELDHKFAGALHQGLAIRASAPPDSTIDAIAQPAKGLILVLDQITDPHNVGAMFRLCAAFGARGIIMQDRKAPPLSGATAKVAVGCVETVPYALVSNIGNTLNDLRQRGWLVTGLAGETDLPLERALILPKNASAPANVIVMGAEGPGLRPRVRDCCDQLARIPMPGGAESLNVSTAAAIAMYEASRSTDVST